MKYFHELTEEDHQELVDEGITYGELDKRHPQPLWCAYPEATHGMMGCWSLIGFLVTGEDFCKTCDLYKK